MGVLNMGLRMGLRMMGRWKSESRGQVGCMVYGIHWLRVSTFCFISTLLDFSSQSSQSCLLLFLLGHYLHMGILGLGYGCFYYGLLLFLLLYQYQYQYQYHIKYKGRKKGKVRLNRAI